MPYLFLLAAALLLPTLPLRAQTDRLVTTDATFEADVLAYAPAQADLPDKQYSFATMVLRENKRQTDNDPAKFDVSDYYNTLVALTTLGESRAVIDLAFAKFLATDRACEYLTSPDLFANGRWTSLRQQIDAEIARCQSGERTNAPSTIPEPTAADGYDAALLRQIREIDERDGRYRGHNNQNLKKQAPLDRANQRIVEALFRKHGTYLGRSLVGRKYEHVMWTVIQHSNPAMMKRYLPVVAAAVKAGELTEAPLRMLIDRYYALTEGFQVFGSQGGDLGVRLADEATRLAIEEEFLNY